MFDARIAPCFKCGSRFLYTACLISIFSATASIIKSQSFNFSISLSYVHGVTRDALLLEKRGAGFNFDNPSTPFCASSSFISNNKDGIPAFAICPAICAPITPAPSTAHFLISILIRFIPF